MEINSSEIKFCHMGFPYYDHVPEGFVKASYQDFFDDDGNLFLGRAILIHSFIHENRYWANRIKPDFPYWDSDMPDFIEAGRVYINTLFN